MQSLQKARQSLYISIIDRQLGISFWDYCRLCEPSELRKLRDVRKESSSK